MAAHKKRSDINLLLEEKTADLDSELILSWVLSYGRYIIIVTQIVVLSVFFARFKLDRDHTDLKESVAQQQAIVESVTDLETEIRRVQKKLIDIKELTVNQNSSIIILRFLQENIPMDTSFTTLNINSDALSFEAISNSMKSFNYFLSKIQYDKKFTEVTLDSIVRLSDGKVKYKIHAKINYKGS